VKTCRVPGCTNVLHASNRSEVCRDHNHTKPHCQCVQCQGQKPSYRPATEDEIRALDEKTRERAGKASQTFDPDASIEELCRPLSATIQPQKNRSWSGGIGSNPGTRDLSHVARQQAAMKFRRESRKRRG